jgi:hypothetical protein
VAQTHVALGQAVRNHGHRAVHAAGAALHAVRRQRRLRRRPPRRGGGRRRTVASTPARSSTSPCRSNGWPTPTGPWTNGAPSRPSSSPEPAVPRHPRHRHASAAAGAVPCRGWVRGCPAGDGGTAGRRCVPRPALPGRRARCRTVGKAVTITLYSDGVAGPGTARPAPRYGGAVFVTPHVRLEADVVQTSSARPHTGASRRSPGTATAPPHGRGKPGSPKRGTP